MGLLNAFPVFFVIFAFAFVGGASAAEPLPVSDFAVSASVLKAAPAIGAVKKDWSQSSKLLVYFWATWCPDCREKLSGPLAELSRRTGRDVLLVATDKDAEKIRAFLSDKAVTLPAVQDESRELRKTLKAFSVPSWTVLEKRDDGYFIVGQESGSDLKKIETLLGKGGS